MYSTFEKAVTTKGMCSAVSLPFPLDLPFSYLVLQAKVSDALWCSTEGEQEHVQIQLPLCSLWVSASSNSPNISCPRFQLQRSVFLQYRNMEDTEFYWHLTQINPKSSVLHPFLGTRDSHPPPLIYSTPFASLV